MKMTYGEIVNRHKVLMETAKLKLPRKVSVAVARNLLKLEEEIGILDKQREDIARQYAKKDKAGNLFIVENSYVFEDAGKEKAFKSEFTELLTMEVDVNILTFDRDELERCELEERYDILSPLQEIWLDWMITKKEE